MSPELTDKDRSGQVLAAYALLGLAAPGTLFAFLLLFGQDSYQYWADRYHVDLTNKYLFARLGDGGLLGPLWREETLAGYLWIVSLVSSPLALDVLAARWLHLSPLGIEVVGALLLYYLSAISLYLYLRRALSLSREAAVSAAATFACATYWDYNLNTNPNVPMAVAWLPALLTVAHGLEATVGRGGDVWWPFAGLALLFAACALHGSLSTLPVTLLLVSTYAVAVLRPRRSGFWVAVALGTGLLLYAPFLWLFVEAASLSHRNAGPGFYPVQALDLPAWVAHGKLMAAQFAVGVNRYGIFLVVLLGVLWWGGQGEGWGGESAGRRRVLRYAAVVSLAIPLIELFHEAINAAKGSLPLVRGWNVQRFADFGSFGVAILVGWMWDRSLFGARPSAPSPTKSWVLRGAIAAVGLLGSLQIGHAAYRLRDVPPSVGPQRLFLYGFLAAYAIVLGGLLVRLWLRSAQAVGAPAGGGGWGGRLADAAHLVAAVALVTSVHAYRSGLVRPQGIEAPSGAVPIMTYAQRYALPEEILALKRLIEREGRVLDLTRPLNSATWMFGSEITLLPLAGVRVLSGYNNLLPAWYGRLIHVGINGNPGSPWNIVQVEDTDRTNFGILPLLDVEYILAPRGKVLPGYRPVAELAPGGKTVFQVEADSRLGPAFVATALRCFAREEDALLAIHAATLSELKARAVLLEEDPAAGAICGREAGVVAQTTPATIRTARGQDRIMVEVEDGPGGILTLSDTYYPGWRVYVNGVERPLLRTYAALRGVAIEPGRQTVEFVFAPPMFYRLLRVSAVVSGGLVLVSLVLWGRRWRGRLTPV